MDTLKTNKIDLIYMNNETLRGENSALIFTLCHQQGKCIHDTKTDLCVLAFVIVKFALNEKL